MMIAMLWMRCLGFGAGFLGAWTMINLSGWLNLKDTAVERSSHSGVVPKGAGIGIIGAFGSASMYLDISPWFWGPVIGISLVSFLGGDKQGLSATFRLILQFGCSSLFLWWLLSSRFPGMGPAVYFLGAFLSVFIVGTANFYNFMDGIDGIAGITGMIAFGLLYQFSKGHSACIMYGQLSQTMIWACLGFLCFNFPHARIFMGDVGSVALGFLLAILMITISSSVLDFLVLAGFLMPFYLDELFSIAVRIRNGQSLLVPHRKHVYQLLANEFGIKHWKISLSYGLAQAVTGQAFMLASCFGLICVVMLYLGAGVLFVGFGFWIHHRAGGIK